MNYTYEHTMLSGRKIRVCSRCTLVIDANGNPDPTWYGPDFIKSFGSVPQDLKCTHGGTNMLALLASRTELRDLVIALAEKGVRLNALELQSSPDTQPYRVVLAQDGRLTLDIQDKADDGNEVNILREEPGLNPAAQGRDSIGL